MLLGKILAIITLVFLGLNTLLTLFDMVSNSDPRKRLADLLTIFFDSMAITAFILLLVY